jgi:hypothetical protein
MVDSGVVDDRKSVSDGGAPLAGGEVRTIPARRDVARQLIVRRGVVWFTRDQDARDHVLRAGEGIRLCPGRSAVVQALRPATFEIVERADAAREHWWKDRDRCEDEARTQPAGS